jgi:hypothetical protein
LHLEHVEVGQSLKFLYSDLFVREEYLLFSERCRNMRQHRDFLGCLILGQPGIGTLSHTPTLFLTYERLIFVIGKSLFLLFFLLDCLAREEVVLFTDYDYEMYLFDAAGVWMYAPDKGLPETAARIFSLVDAPDDKKPLPAQVTTKSFPKTFFVGALSPAPAWYHELKKMKVLTWWMQPWETEELVALWVSCCWVCVPTDP